MKRFFLAVTCAAFFAPCAYAAQETPAMRVGMIAFQGDTLFDGDYFQSVRSALDKCVRDNYAVEGAFEVIEENRNDYMDALDRQGEEYMISYLEGRDLDLVLFSEMSTDGRQVVFKCYQKTGLFDDFYLPYSAGLDRFLPEVSVGTFLSLIERVDGRLFDNRRY